jgi:hypothetical protein
VQIQRRSPQKKAASKHIPLGCESNASINGNANGNININNRGAFDKPPVPKSKYLFKLQEL